MPDIGDHIEYGLVIRASAGLFEIIQDLPLALEDSLAPLQELNLLEFRPTVNFCDQPSERSLRFPKLV
jgi:hypothetical protein